MGCGASRPVPTTIIAPNKETRVPTAAEAEAEVTASRTALEAALAADADSVEALAERYACAIAAAPGKLPPPSTYTDVKHIFAALRPAPGSGSGLVPVRLLRTSWIKARAALVRKATSDDERRRLRLPRRQDLERDEPEAFMPVEELEQLPRSDNGSLAAGASSYC